jgi:hypothetical protein
MSDYKCENGKCVQTKTTCEIGKFKCLGNSVYKCFANEGWKMIENCFSKACIENSSVASCIDLEKTCFEWGDFVLENKSSYTDTDELKRERNCTNFTYVKKCTDYRGNETTLKDYVYNQTCGDWNEICEIQLYKKEYYTRESKDKNGLKICSDCTDEIYAPNCENSGFITQNQTKKTSCTDWKICDDSITNSSKDKSFIERLVEWFYSFF